MQVLQLSIEINYGQSLSNNSKPQIGENDYNKRVMVDPKKRLRDLAEEGSYFKARHYVLQCCVSIALW